MGNPRTHHLHMVESATASWTGTLRFRDQGNATHLGLFTREEVILLDPGTGTFEGQIVYTAANGDQLSGTVSGGFTSPTTATGIYIFSSGTGRFANASGSANFVLATPNGLDFKVRFEGSLY